jgi:hypothetical protein
MTTSKAANSTQKSGARTPQTPKTGAGTALAEPEEQQKTTRRRNVAEFAIDPHDETLILLLQQHLAATSGEHRSQARILRMATHRGLLEEIALAGPNRDGFYAGKYTGKELAELLRQSALMLADLQSRHTTPILQASAWPAGMGMVMAAGNTSPNGNASGPTQEAILDEKGAVALRGLGTGLMKRNNSNRAAPPPD